MDRKWRRSVMRYAMLLALVPGALTNQSIRSEDKDQSLGSPIQQLLAKECSGEVVDRRSLIKEGDDKNSHWQAGEIQRGGRWASVHDLGEQSPKELEYERLRAELKGDSDKDRKLAKWCDRHELTMQAKAHWSAVIVNLPNDAEARRRLGHQLVDGAWYSETEVKSAASNSKQRLKDLRQWSGPVSKIIQALKSSSASEKQAALRKLNDINEPSAISCLELAALQTDHDVAKLMVDAISKHRSKEACMALTRIALAEPDSARGLYAIQKLKQYDQTFMVPELLNLLVTPVETKVQMGFNDRGELLLERIMMRETKDRREMIQMQRLVRTNEMGENIATRVGNVAVGRATGRANGIVQVFDDERAANSLALDDQLRLEREIAEANQEQEELSRKASFILSSISDQPAATKAEAWWKWWQDKNYRKEGSKPLSLKQYQQVDRPALTLNSYEVSMRVGHECLVAGTLVQTSAGMRAIETLNQGDLVVAQDVDTGKMDLKPVLQVVPRDPGLITVIKTDSDEIRSTQGHRWWVSGTGWVMAADLRVGMTLHTATGSVRISEVREEPERPTFNLVVDEYHTYFVGKDRLLSFDVVDPRPTLCKVPGYK